MLCFFYGNRKATSHRKSVTGSVLEATFSHWTNFAHTEREVFLLGKLRNTFSQKMSPAKKYSTNPAKKTGNKDLPLHLDLPVTKDICISPTSLFSGNHSALRADGTRIPLHHADHPGTGCSLHGLHVAVRLSHRADQPDDDHLLRAPIPTRIRRVVLLRKAQRRRRQ